MKILSLSLLLILSVSSCNTTNKVTDTKNNTENQMDKKEMISNGYIEGKISISSEEGDCPTTIMVEGKSGAYYLDPINISEEFKTNNESVFFKFHPLRQMNRCEKASPIEITDIVKSN